MSQERPYGDIDGSVAQRRCSVSGWEVPEELVQIFAMWLKKKTPTCEGEGESAGLDSSYCCGVPQRLESIMA